MHKRRTETISKAQIAQELGMTPEAMAKHLEQMVGPLPPGMRLEFPESVEVPVFDDPDVDDDG